MVGLAAWLLFRVLLNRGSDDVLSVAFFGRRVAVLGLSREPLMRSGMPISIDDDLQFEVDGRVRPTRVANL